MIYEFGYYFSEEKDKHITIEASSDREAVLKLFDTVGICEFGCIKSDGDCFSDDDYLEEKDLIKRGC